MSELFATYDTTVVPRHFYTKYPKLVQLINTYYRWLATVDSKDIEASRNIDVAESAAAQLLANEYAAYFPTSSDADLLMVGRHAKQIFRARGTKDGIEALFRLFLNVQATVTFPGKYVFKPSADRFAKRYEIQVSNGQDLKTAVGKLVSTTSGGSFVLLDVQEFTDGDSAFTKLIVEDVTQGVEIGDSIIVVGVVTNCVIFGSCTDVVVANAFGESYVGQPVSIVATNGEAKAVVSGTTVTTDQAVYVNIATGGGHYTKTPEFKVSDAVIVTSNTVTALVGQTVTQQAYQINAKNAIAVDVGTAITLIRVDGGNVIIANTAVTVIATPTANVLANTYPLIVTSSGLANNIVASTFVASGNTIVVANATAATATGTVIAVSSGVFNNQIGVVTSNNKFYATAVIAANTANITASSISYFDDPKASVTSLGAALPVVIIQPSDTAFLAANTTSVTIGANTYRQAVIGTIDRVAITFRTPPSKLNTDPFVVVTQPLSINKPSLQTLTVESSGHFIGGETITQYANGTSITVANATNYVVGDVVVSPSNASPTFTGVVTAISGKVLSLGDTVGSIANTATIVNKTTGGSTSATIVNTAASVPVAIGRVVSKDHQSITIRTTAKSFSNTGNVLGSVSRRLTPVTNVATSSNTGGFNCVVEGYINRSTPAMATVKVTSSGYGITTNRAVDIYNSDNVKIATGFAVVKAVGSSEVHRDIISSGISQVSKITDSFYWQQYAYQINSPLSFETYNDVIEQYVHVSGTRMFGGVTADDTQQSRVTSTTYTTIA